jgi:hypothetical protein
MTVEPELFQGGGDNFDAPSSFGVTLGRWISAAASAAGSMAAPLIPEAAR